MGCKTSKKSSSSSETDKIPLPIGKQKITMQKRMLELVPEPIKTVLTVDDVFENGKDAEPNVSKLKSHLEGEGRLSTELTLRLIYLVKEIARKEPNVLRLNGLQPVNIIGDIHGQFYDLLTIFSLGQSALLSRYLFLGDFVDRGLFGFECVCYLYCLKVKYPERIFLLRGNHESRHLTRFFTFREECLLKGNELVYEAFMDSFDTLPIAALLDNKFCKYR
jgi:serine/threonine-protein phosphatase 2B catalytic subunit